MCVLAPLDDCNDGCTRFTQADLDEIRHHLRNPLNPRAEQNRPYVVSAVEDYLREKTGGGMSQAEATLSLLELVAGSLTYETAEVIE